MFVTLAIAFVTLAIALFLHEINTRRAEAVQTAANTRANAEWRAILDAREAGDRVREAEAIRVRLGTLYERYIMDGVDIELERLHLLDALEALNS